MTKDCVSRQAVLEELQACVDTESIYDENNGLTYICYEDAVNWVEKMPLVTPTHGTCKDCAIKQLDKSESAEVGTEKYYCSIVSRYVDETPSFYCADFEEVRVEND